MTAILDYSTGNIRSVVNAFRRAGADDLVLTADPSVIFSAERVVLPGVGDASEAMKALRGSGLADLVPQLRCPVLGICVGLQLMCRSSEEGNVACLGIFDAPVRRFADIPGLKVPHMGWNSISELRSPLFEGIDEGSFVYYVHSFRPDLSPDAVCTTDHGGRFAGALARDNFFGTQFHPEKSGPVGERILRNFLAMK